MQSRLGIYKVSIQHMIRIFDCRTGQIHPTQYWYCHETLLTLHPPHHRTPGAGGCGGGDGGAGGVRGGQVWPQQLGVARRGDAQAQRGRAGARGSFQLRIA